MARGGRGLLPLLGQCLWEVVPLALGVLAHRLLQVGGGAGRPHPRGGVLEGFNLGLLLLRFLGLVPLDLSVSPQLEMRRIFTILLRCGTRGISGNFGAEGWGYRVLVFLSLPRASGRRAL